MREKVDRDKLQRFMKDFAAEAKDSARVYLTGGATAVLFGWRDATIDIDLEIFPENDRLVRSITSLRRRAPHQG